MTKLNSALLTRLEELIKNNETVGESILGEYGLGFEQAAKTYSDELKKILDEFKLYKNG